MNGAAASQGSGVPAEDPGDCERIHQLHQITLNDVLDGHARSRPDECAVVCADVRLSWAELSERVDALATALLQQGVSKKDRLLWVGQNCHRILELLLAASRLGAVLCPANWRQSPSEIAFVVDDCRPAIVVWQEAEIGEAALGAMEKVSFETHWVQHDGTGEDSYESLIGAGRALTKHGQASASAASHKDGVAQEVDELDPVLMLYTAAFSGRPNGALLSQRALITQGTFMAQLQEIGADYVYLNCGPLFHVATLMTTLATVLAGGTNVFTLRSDAEELCRLISRERCTGAFLMPPTMDQIIELNAETQRGERPFDLTCLRTFAGKPEWTAMITLDTSPWGRHPAGYGQTEVMGLATFNALGPAKGSAGRPPPFVHLGIMGPGGELLGPGEVGEIVVRGPTVMNGYHDRPELNAQRRQGGWHHTTDIGRLEDDGSLTFIGPKTRLIKSAAENIYPAEVEACIRGLPGVSDVAVIGEPDRTWGQNVVAIVVPTDDEAGKHLTAEAVITHCRAGIASYKKPKRVEIVSSLPRQGFAIDYEALDQTYGGGGYPGT